MTEPFVACLGVLETLMEHEDSGPFNQPVDAEELGLPDYRDIVKKPMDLSTIKVEKNNPIVSCSLNNDMRYRRS